MDEIAEAGYEGTELGPWGFYPTTPHVLHAELSARGLSLVGAFLDVPLHDPAQFDRGREAAREVVPLLTALGAPVLILSAQMTPDRARIAGRVTEAHSLSAGQWKQAAAYLGELSQIAGDVGLVSAFHHHAGTYVETVGEIERLFEEVDPTLMGLCLDTGHLAYGGGDNMRLLSRYGGIIRHMHLKNADPSVLTRVREGDMSYVEAVREGIFCPLDAGSVDIPAVVEALRRVEYDGWLVVEQDIDLARPEHLNPLEGATRARRFLREVVGI